MGDDITIGVTEIVNNIEVTAQPNDQIVDISVIDNTDEVTLNITPTVIEINVNKGSSYAKWGTILGTLSDQEDLQDALDLKANLVDGKVPASELPSYVDDVIEVADYASLPVTGEIGKIYITLDDNKIYRWSGSIYIEIASNNAIWGAITGTLSNQLDLQAALNLKANDADVVKLTGDQTITGTKSFNSSTSIGIRQNNSGNGYGIYSENASNGFGYYVANNGSGKAISVANALGSFGNMYEGSYNGTNNFYVDYSGKVNAPIFELQPNNTIGSTPNYIGQTMATNDNWKIYGNTIALDYGEMVFEIGDNGVTDGQRFRFFYNSSGGGGTNKNPFILNYNDATFNTNATFSGNVGIGTTTPASIVPGTNLTINGTSGGYASLFLQYNNVDKAFFSATASDLIIGSAGASTNMSFYSGGSERMRITSGGTALFGRTTSFSSGYSIGFRDAMFGAVTTNGNNLINFFNASDSYVASIVVNASTIVYGIGSDYRLKEDLKDFNGLEKVSKIKVYDFKFIEEGDRMEGVLAHELQEIVPYAVTGEKDGLDSEGNIKIQNVDYSKLVPILVKAIQELNEKINKL